jgi:hypothetical protein
MGWDKLTSSSTCINMHSITSSRLHPCGMYMCYMMKLFMTSTISQTLRRTTLASTGSGFQRTEQVRVIFCRPAQANTDNSSRRPREAIECLQHALLYADPLELTTNLKIADIFDQDLHDHRQAALYHQRVVEASTRRGSSLVIIIWVNILYSLN